MLYFISLIMVREEINPLQIFLLIKKIKPNKPSQNSRKQSFNANEISF